MLPAGPGYVHVSKSPLKDNTFGHFQLPVLFKIHLFISSGSAGSSLLHSFALLAV